MDTFIKVISQPASIKVISEGGSKIDQKAKEEEGQWVTMHGSPVFIREGQSAAEAAAERFGGDKKPSKASSADAVSKIKDELKNKKTEHMVIIKDGKVVLQRKGGSETVKLSDSERKQMKDAVVMHNHPAEEGFSADDWAVAIENNVKESQVVTPGGSTFTMKRPGDSWGVAIGWKMELGRVSDDVFNKYERLRLAKKVSKDEAITKYSSEMSKRLSKRWGIPYTEEKKKQ